MLPSLDPAQWAIVAIYGALLIAAGVSDFRHRKIPNWSVIALIVLYVPWVFLGPGVSWTSGLMSFGVALIGTVLLYLMRVIGAGDSKLFSAAALFSGLKLLGALALATALIGGAIAIVVLSALDNLTKGSSGQALQNANLMLGLPETMGLMAAPLFP